MMGTDPVLNVLSSGSFNYFDMGTDRERNELMSTHR